MVPTPKEAKIGLPAKNMPAIAAMTVRPEISTARPDVAAAVASASCRAALVALLHLPAQVEHRVVDADGQADERHDLPDDRRELLQAADRAEQPDRADDGGRAEHERHPGGHEGSERGEQDQQRRGIGEELGRPLVAVVLLGERLRGGRAAELLDAHARVVALDGGDGGERPTDVALGVLVAAGQREAHGDRAAVAGDRLRALRGIQRALDLRDAVDPPQAGDDRFDAGADLRVPRSERALALHEYLLAGLLAEVRGVDDHVAALALAVAGRRVGDVVLADLAADQGGRDHEQDPAEDRRLAVLRAPASGARRAAAVLHWAASLRTVERTACTLPARRASTQPGDRPRSRGLAGVSGRGASPRTDVGRPLTRGHSADHGGSSPPPLDRAPLTRIRR